MVSLASWRGAQGRAWRPRSWCTTSWRPRHPRADRRRRAGEPAPSAVGDSAGRAVTAEGHRTVASDLSDRHVNVSGCHCDRRRMPVKAAPPSSSGGRAPGTRVHPAVLGGLYEPCEGGDDRCPRRSFRAGLVARSGTRLDVDPARLASAGTAPGATWPPPSPCSPASTADRSRGFEPSSHPLYRGWASGQLADLLSCLALGENSAWSSSTRQRRGRGEQLSIG
jgi:hypothetical protein